MGLLIHRTHTFQKLTWLTPTCSFIENLRNTDLRGADLAGATLLEANLTGADLFQATVSGAKGFHVDLRKGNLEGARLRGADLIGTILSDANLSDADLRRARNLTQEQLDEACGTGSVKLDAPLTFHDRPCRPPDQK